MIGSALETMLFCTIAMCEADLRAAGHWPEDRRDPLRWELGRMVDIAIGADWFPTQDASGLDVREAVKVLNYVRSCMVHPAAYVRENAYLPGEREFAACFGVMLAADDALMKVVQALP